MDPQTAVSDRIRAVLVPAALAVAAVLLGVGLWRAPEPVPAAQPVPGWVIDPTPIRRPVLKPQYQVAGFSMRCSDCHDLFPSPTETDRPLTQHTEIVLKHGINTRCFNCHHPTRRDFFVDDRGGEIPFDQPPLLCARCHGPTYRDWLHGAHGRTNGFWNKRMGPQEHRKCVECHNPHEPPFPPMQPAPGPHTLHMGDQTMTPEEAAVRNPLRIYQQDGADQPPVADEQAGGIDHE